MTIKFKLVMSLVMMGLLSALCATTSLAQARAYTPGKGSAERKAISDALRVPVEKKLNQGVVFKIDHLKVKDGWALLLGAPRRTNGGRIDYRKTEYAEAKREGMFDDNIVALLRKVNGKWDVVEYVIGATDVAYIGWDEKHRAPAAIFPG